MASRLKWTLALVATAALLPGCQAFPMAVGPEPPQGYTAGSTVRGSSCGLLLFGLIPIGVNERTEDAYKDALKGHAGGLTDTRISYAWHIIPAVGLQLCTDVEGKLIQ